MSAKQQRRKRAPPVTRHSSSSSSSSSESEDDKKKKKNNVISGKLEKKLRKKPKSWERDDEDPGLILPRPAFEDSDEENEYRQLKYEKRLNDFLSAQEQAREIALDSGDEDEREFDDVVALAGADKELEPEDIDRKAVERDFTDDAIVFNYETGKLEMKRPIVPRWFADYNLFKPDDTIVLNGKRRTGKSFMMRKILYEMRHCFWGGVVFTATKHNGFWQQMVPRRFIHETLNTEVIDQLLRYRAAEIDAIQMRFGADAVDNLYYFVVLDDMVFNFSSRYPL